MRHNATLYPVYGEDLYEDKFEAFLFVAILEFQEGVDLTSYSGSLMYGGVIGSGEVIIAQ